MNKTYYEILGVSETSTQEEIVSAFRTLAKKYHPDLNHDENAKELFEAAYEAYDILKDPTKRALYDDRLRVCRINSQKQTYSNTESQKNNHSDSYSAARNRQYNEYQAQARSKAREYAQKDFKTFSEEIWGVVTKVAKGTASATVAIAEGAAIGALQGCIIGLYKLVIGVILLLVFGGIPFLIMTCQSTVENNQREEIFSDIYDTMETGLYFREYPFARENYSFNGKKILLVDMDDRDIFYRFWFINERYQATTDDEIDYLIQIDTNNVVVGHYSDGASALRNDYTLRIVDYRKKVTVTIITAQGDEPPMSKRGSGNAGGGNDLYERLEKWFGHNSD